MAASTDAAESVAATANRAESVTAEAPTAYSPAAHPGPASVAAPSGPMPVVPLAGPATAPAAPVTVSDADAPFDGPGDAFSASLLSPPRRYAAGLPTARAWPVGDALAEDP
ncbi:hypothetical protein LO772_24430 [Yinghuangia sp. ASG 101]|uniref:hypothetical protein n=1 Tax=Yinghuangia sp. ASG 101 TaxID=2896848 RepID=UPI001E624A58|nr:hypothetical protein [Yinghuangia sp. ASG 101]UGQ10017.1 hypothetical protein LO772_24430 [Yinghuangia sp. ASG 101]